MQHFRAAIFDMDGLMIDSESLQLKSINIALASLGIELSREEWASKVGIKSIETLRALKSIHGFSMDPEELERVKNEAYQKLIADELEVMPGLYEALTVFQNGGYRVALASSSIKKTIEFVLKRFSIAEFFEVVVSGDEVSKGKPNPEIFLKAAWLLHVIPSECIVLEDTTHGITAAKAAGMFAIAIPSEFTLHQDFRSADRVLKTLSEITPEFLSTL